MKSCRKGYRASMARHTQYSFHGTNYGTLAAAKKAAQQYANDTGRKTYVSVDTLVKSNQGNYTDYKMVELAPKSRKKNPTVSTSSLPIGTWQPAHAIRQNADGSVDILREKNSGRRANISEGFMAGGVFHPIRHSADYDASRVGESGKKKRKAPAKKKASTKRAMVTSRREYGGDGSRYRNAGKLVSLTIQKWINPNSGWRDVKTVYNLAEAKAMAKAKSADDYRWPYRVVELHPPYRVKFMTKLPAGFEKNYGKVGK